MKILDQVKEIVGGATVFGEPYEKDGLTVIPAATVAGGGGGGQQAGEQGAGGGAGVQARPAGAFVIMGDEVSWVPAFDVNRAVLLSQLVLLVGLLCWRSVARATARAKSR
jgi:uncharacterized spore protein YtfJ